MKEKTNLEKLRDELKHMGYENHVFVICEAILKDDEENKKKSYFTRYILLICNIKKGIK